MYSLLEMVRQENVNGKLMQPHTTPLWHTGIWNTSATYYNLAISRIQENNRTFLAIILVDSSPPCTSLSVLPEASSICRCNIPFYFVK